MKKKIFNYIVILICGYVLVELLIRKELIYSSITYALKIWVNNLIPALFPFFIISDILINYNITGYIPKIIKKICKWLWKITDNMLTILLLSIISGFPSNARNTRILFDKGNITLDEANHILMFSHFSNPVFILTTVGLFFFGNEKAGIIILISHYLSNFILGIICRGSFKHNDNCSYSKEGNINFGNVLVNAIKRAIDTTLLICGIVTIFLMLASIIVSTFNLNIYNGMLVKGLLEITIGIEAVSKLDISILFKMVVASCFLAFGGLSVHLQVMSQLVDTKINYHYFFLGRIWQMILSGIITYVIGLLVI